MARSFHLGPRVTFHQCLEGRKEAGWMFDQYSGLSLGHSSHGLEVTLIVWVIRTCSFSLLDKLVGRNPTGIKANIHIFFLKGRKSKASF